MLKILFALTVVIGYFGSVGADAIWDDDSRQSITYAHNEKRKEEGGCDMIEMQYSMELERLAKAWTLLCLFAHQNKGLGENLFKLTTTRSHEIPITQAVNMWAGEKKYFINYGVDCSLSQCGHYTQLVWASTAFLGCYANYCAGWWLIVCFYWPRGNYQGALPANFDCSSKCSAGLVEVNGLCRNNMTENDVRNNVPSIDTTNNNQGNDNDGGANTNDCHKNTNQVKCEDKSRMCLKLIDQGACTGGPMYSFMQRNCKKTCDLC